MSANFNDQRFSRQDFIGDQELLETTPIGVLGLGGGGASALAQLAHLGCGDVVGYDPNEHVEEKHLNRTHGLTVADVQAKISKVQNAIRLYEGLLPNAKAVFIQKRWQEEPGPLKRCKLVIGCLDNIAERAMAEAFCRENRIPYLDIGLDVTKVQGSYPRLAGQIITSVPGAPCMRCLGFITDELLGEEAAQYGDAGPRAQVGFGNSVLVGIAIGIASKMITGWAGSVRHPLYLQYEGNDDYVTPHPRLKYLLAQACPHYPPLENGTQPEV